MVQIVPGFLKKGCHKLTEIIQRRKVFLALMFSFFMIVFAMMGAGIGGILEYWTGDLGFQNDYIAENGLQETLEKEGLKLPEYLEQTELNYEEMRDARHETMGVMEKWKRAFTGNVAKWGASMGAITGLGVALLFAGIGKGYTLREDVAADLEHKLRYGNLHDEQKAFIANVLSIKKINKEQKTQFEKKLGKIYENEKRWGAKLITKKIAHLFFWFTAVSITFGALGYTGVIPGELVAAGMAFGGLVTVFCGVVSLTWKYKEEIGTVLAASSDILKILEAFKRRRLSESEQALCDGVPRLILILAAFIFVITIRKVLGRFTITSSNPDLRKSLDDIIVQIA